MNVPVANLQHVELVHIARDPLYKSEKPYAADFEAPGRRSNHIFDTSIVSIEDARPNMRKFTLETNGFCLTECPSIATFASLSADQSAVHAYYHEMEQFVQEQYPQYSRVVAIEHQLRQRPPGYPETKLQKKDGAQPARLVHRDFTTEGLFRRMELSFPGREDEYKKRGIDIINLWRVLVEPNNDWPLAVCDFTSIVPELDTIPNDMLSRTAIGENELLFAHPRHKWFFLSGQRKNEVIVFRNASTEGEKSYAFHSAFDSKLPSLVPRQSIELRLAAFS